jgi:hypothetical protein
MPWPGTDIPAPWDPKPTAAPPDTTQRDALVKTLTAQHGGQVGSASTPMVKNPQDPSGPEIPGPYDLYTFADGTSVEIAPTGEVSTYTVKTPSGTSGWTDITEVRNKDQSITFYGKDPKDPSGPLKPVEGLPTSAAPASVTAKPTPSAQLDSLDSKGNVVPAGDPSAKQMRDPATGTTFNLVTDPAGALHDLGNDVILVKPDGSYTKVASKPKEAQQFNVPGVGFVNFDPNQPAGSQVSVLLKTPAPNDPKTEVRDGVTYQYDPDSRTWLKTDLPAQVDIGYTYNDPNSDQIIFYDKSGKEVSRTTKPNYKPPVQVQPGSAPAADLISPKIPTFNPQTGALEFVDNPNQIKASDATSQLAQQLGLKVAAGSMSEKQAQDLITGAVNTMNAQTSRMTAEANQQQNITTAAGDVLANTRANAQTAGSLLQQRAQAATGTLQSILGQTLQNKNITSYPSDVGANLVQGLSGWTADLMGGQATLDSAARMVQMADPRSDNADPSTQAAIGTLSQMLDKYQQLTGTPHPAVAATQAAQLSQQQGGAVAPNTAPQATPAVQAVQATPAVGAGFTPPGGSSYSYPSVPWAGAVPQTLQSQAGAGVGSAFRAPATIVINAGGG